VIKLKISEGKKICPPFFSPFNSLKNISKNIVRETKKAISS